MKAIVQKSEMQERISSHRLKEMKQKKKGGTLNVNKSMMLPELPSNRVSVERVVRVTGEASEKYQKRRRSSIFDDTIIGKEADEEVVHKNVEDYQGENNEAKDLPINYTEEDEDNNY